MTNSELFSVAVWSMVCLAMLVFAYKFTFETPSTWSGGVCWLLSVFSLWFLLIVVVP